MRRMSLFIVIAALIVVMAAIDARSDKESRYHESYSGKVTASHHINYHGYLTDAAGNSINGKVDMTLSIWDATQGGTCIWTEEQSVALENGLFNVQLGTFVPIPADVLTGACWLETQVEDELLLPRKQLTSDALMGQQSGVMGPPITIGGGVPSTHATPWVFGVLNSGTGRGLSTRSEGGHAIYVENAGVDGVHIQNAFASGLAVGHAGGHGVQVLSADDHGIVVNDAGLDGVRVSSADDDGIRVDNAGRYGVYVADAENGVYVKDASSSGYWVHTARKDGFYVTIADWSGLVVGHALEDGILVTNADQRGAYLINNNSASGQPTLYLKNTDTSGRLINAYSGSDLRYYFQGDGYAYADGGWSTFKKNSKGKYESFSAIEATHKEIVAHGTGKLMDGVARIEFDKSFTDFVSMEIPIEVTVTPKAGAGLYVPECSHSSFTVRAWAGDPDCQFNWIAIGREKSYKRRATIPDLDEEMRYSELDYKRIKERQRVGSAKQDTRSRGQ